MSNNVNTINIAGLEQNSTSDIGTDIIICDSDLREMNTVGVNGTAGYDFSNISITGGGISDTLWSSTSSPNTVWTTNTGDWSIGTSVNQSGTMDLRGENADIRINGRSLMDAIDALEQRLNILVPNPELEKEWDELRELGERYRELERQCKEKGNMWAKLKEIKK